MELPLLKTTEKRDSETQLDSFEVRCIPQLSASTGGANLKSVRCRPCRVLSREPRQSRFGLTIDLHLWILTRIIDAVKIIHKQICLQLELHVIALPTATIDTAPQRHPEALLDGMKIWKALVSLWSSRFSTID